MLQRYEYKGLELLKAPILKTPYFYMYFFFMHLHAFLSCDFFQ